MLKAGAPPPEGRFADLAVLAQVRDFPARHASTLLAFEAAADARSAPPDTALRQRRRGGLIRLAMLPLGLRWSGRLPGRRPKA